MIGNEVFICEGLRTPIGKYGGALASIRADDLAAIPIQALIARHPQVDWGRVDEVIYGCANQAGEDNRNVARMASLLAGLPVEVPAVTVNRLCGSGMEAVGQAARAIATGEADLILAGGVESMSRAPFVMGKAESAYSRQALIFDTTMGWRFVNPKMKKQYGIDSMPETADHVAADFNVARADQDAFAWRSQQRYQSAHRAGRFQQEIVPIDIPLPKGASQRIDTDEHPRATTMEALAKLRGINGEHLSVTAGNASGINDGACALLLANAKTVSQYRLTPQARVVAMASAGVLPRIMGMGPVFAVRKLLARTHINLADINVIELNEAFAAQALAVLRALGLPDDGEHINPNGGAIALGHPLGMSGARLVATACIELQRRQTRYALTTMCIGVGQGLAMLIERV